MKYILKHKNVDVALFELDVTTGTIASVEAVFSPDHLPFGIVCKKGSIDRSSLNSWLRKRSIPASRDGLKEALNKLRITSPDLLIEKCYGLSLSDQYWICPEDRSILWEEVNFFDNDFSEDVGNILINAPDYRFEPNLMSPDNTSDGWLRKKWSIQNGKRVLWKGGSGATQQEPYNEMIACAVMKTLGVPHVEYSLHVFNEYPYSVCEDFITTDTELVPAYQIIHHFPKPNHVSAYTHFILCCERVGLRDTVLFSDKMLVTDFILANEDRHWNNFGAIRSADTLDFIGFAPLYDSGTSLWCNTPTALIKPISPKAPSKPFKETHADQIRLVSDFSWIDLAGLEEIPSYARSLIESSPYIDNVRRDAIVNGLKARIELLKQVAR